ncbi:MAG: hypothetical protein KGL53_10615, partial [Elusimicrobia bacterium]|nr:hypothetical protein [Elusimicrobiota bacterium]
GPVLSNDERYDPAADAWTARAPMPTARYGLAAAAVGGKLYAVGGNASSSSYLATDEQYDPAADTWTSKAPMPAARSSLAAAVVDGKLYVVGGFDGHSYLTTNAAYDPAADVWTAKSPMPTGRYGLAAATVGGKLFAIGGNSGPVLSNDERYDPVADSWTVEAPMPTARYKLAAAAVGGKVFAVGGYGNAGYLAANEAYDPQADTWVAQGAMPTARESPSAVAVGASVYVVGGDNGPGSAANEEFDPGVAHEFTGLSPNTQYAFTAKARNADGVETATVAASTYTLAVAAAPAAGNPLVASLSSASAVVQWDGSLNAPGATFVLQASTMSTFAPVLATVSASTASAAVSGLLPNSTVYFRVEAFNSLGGTDGSWTTIGSTRTLIEPPSSIVFDDVSSTTLVASAYAPTPAFHNLGQGQSGTDIAVGGVFQGWHGSTWTEKATLATAREDAAF